VLIAVLSDARFDVRREADVLRFRRAPREAALASGADGERPNSSAVNMTELVAERAGCRLTMALGADAGLWTRCAS
jgi:hypothetical protein